MSIFLWYLALCHLPIDTSPQSRGIYLALKCSCCPITQSLEPLSIYSFKTNMMLRYVITSMLVLASRPLIFHPLTFYISRATLLHTFLHPLGALFDLIVYLGDKKLLQAPWHSCSDLFHIQIPHWCRLFYTLTGAWLVRLLPRCSPFGFHYWRRLPQPQALTTSDFLDSPSGLLGEA